MRSLSTGSDQYLAEHDQRLLPHSELVSAHESHSNEDVNMEIFFEPYQESPTQGPWAYRALDPLDPCVLDTSFKHSSPEFLWAQTPPLPTHLLDIAPLIGQPLTKFELERWLYEPGISSLDRRDRDALAQIILEAVQAPPSVQESVLPQSLHIPGNLDPIKLDLDTFDGHGLTNLPAGLSVGGDLYLGHCISLNSLPADLSVGGNLCLEGCIGLNSLPADLSVGGSLYLAYCTSLNSIPASLSVGGSLYLRGCSMNSIPTGLSVGDSLSLEGCTSLTSLPTGLSVGGSLLLQGCTSLTSLPTDLSVGNALYLEGCTGLTSFPADLSVGNNLDRIDCTSLTGLFMFLGKTGSLFLQGCTSLTSLPTDLSVKGDLFLEGCTSLTSLPTDLSVKGDLFLEGCTSLTSLPTDLSMGGDLDLQGCTSLASLPTNLSVGGDLYLQGCTSLTSLPDNIVDWGPRKDDGRTRTIDITSTGISATVRAALAASNPRGIQFHFSESSTHVAQPAFAHVAEAALFWHTAQVLDSAALTGPVNIASWELDSDEALHALTYLHMLRGTAEYLNAQTRPLLAERVSAVLTMMDITPALRSLCCTCMRNATTSCGDRIILAMNDMELLALTHKAEHSGMTEASLRTLGLSMLKLDLVRKQARLKCKTLSFVDEIEVVLLYETKLRETLGLPVSTRSMLYGAEVTEQDLAHAAQEVIRAAHNAEEQKKFFADWAPWQAHIRRQQAALFVYAKLTPQALSPAEARELVCTITKEPLDNLKDPVLYLVGESWHVCEAESFLSWWQPTGKTPHINSRAIALTELRRPVV